MGGKKFPPTFLEKVIIKEVKGTPIADKEFVKKFIGFSAIKYDRSKGMFNMTSLMAPYILIGIYNPKCSEIFEKMYEKYYKEHVVNIFNTGIYDIPEDKIELLVFLYSIGLYVYSKTAFVEEHDKLTPEEKTNMANIYFDILWNVYNNNNFTMPELTKSLRFIIDREGCVERNIKSGGNCLSKLVVCSKNLSSMQIIQIIKNQSKVLAAVKVDN